MNAATYRVRHLTTGRTATGTLGEIHNALTGWLASDGADLDTLAAADQLADALERGTVDRYRLEIHLGVEIDQIGATS